MSAFLWVTTAVGWVFDFALYIIGAVAILYLLPPAYYYITHERRVDE